MRKWLFCFLMGIGSAFAEIEWSTPVVISSMGSTNNFSNQVAFGSSGLGAGVWIENDGFFSIAWASTFTEAGGWTTPVQISNSGSNADSPLVGVDENKNVLIVWRKPDNDNPNIFSIQFARLPFGGVWSSPSAVTTNQNGSNSISFAMAGNGNAIVTWFDVDSMNSDLDVECSLYDWGLNSWSSSISVATNLTPVNDQPDVAIDGVGNGMVVFSYGNPANIYASYIDFDMQSASSPILIGISPMSSQANMKVGMSTDGNAGVVWSGNPGGVAIYANYYINGTGWASASQISDASFGIGSFDLAINGTGPFYAGWSNSDNASTLIQVRNFDFETEMWSSVTNITTTPATSASQVAIGSNSGGDAVLLFKGAIPDDDGDSICAAYTTTDPETWTDAAQILPNPAYPTIVDFYSPRVGVASTGEALINYIGENIPEDEEESITYIFGAFGDIDSPVNPITGLSGKQTLCRFPAQGDRINMFGWNSSGVGYTYRIYRNNLSTLIAVTSSANYQDHQRPKGVSTTYYIVPISPETVEGDPVTITLP